MTEMTSYACLVRGINVGGKNKVVMAQLRQELTDLGLDQVQTYINSGNIFFDGLLAREDLVAVLSAFFQTNYPFIETFSLFSAADYRLELENLPAWWSEDLARKDVLFYTDSLGRETLSAALTQLELGDEVLYVGRLGVFWGKYDEGTYSRTAYHRQLLKQPFYKNITIRNHKTFAKLGYYLTP